MNIPAWVYDPWFISIATLFLTLLAEPLFAGLVRKVRSWFGAFTGTYLAITGHQGGSDRLVELVKCQHIGDSVRGKIFGVAHVEMGDGKLVEKVCNNAVYRFTGTVTDRLFVLSYRTTRRGAKAAGTITLQLDSSGRILKGIWGGFDAGEVKSAPCEWVRVRSGRLSLRNRAAIVQEVKRMNTLGPLRWSMRPEFEGKLMFKNVGVLASRESLDGLLDDYLESVRTVFDDSE
jgi:hypothetical protein